MKQHKTKFNKTIQATYHKSFELVNFNLKKYKGFIFQENLDILDVDATAAFNFLSVFDVLRYHLPSRRMAKHHPHTEQNTCFETKRQPTFQEQKSKYKQLRCNQV